MTDAQEIGLDGLAQDDVWTGPCNCPPDAPSSLARSRCAPTCLAQVVERQLSHTPVECAGVEVGRALEQESPVLVRHVAELRTLLRTWRDAGDGIALVPTMGALHDGHLTLIRQAKVVSNRVIVSIFVNPRQFGPQEDFARYPRQEAQDVEKAIGAGAALVFAPSAAEMYPEGYATTISVAGISARLCGAHRPGHFDGVATVVAKLLIQAMPDVAVFGEKDYQQLQVVKRLARDLDLPVRIAGVPTVREKDGLAMSSRNVHLSPAQRRIAPAMAATLHAMAESLAKDGGDVKRQIAWGLQQLRAAGFDSVEYLEVCDAATLEAITAVGAPARILAAARLGNTRLIDNVPVAGATV
jgi:pantoate--beta-alanine ligase